MAAADSRTAPRPAGAGEEIVVTGIGALTPIGSDAPSMWQGLLAAANGARSLPDWPDDVPVKFAAQLSDEAEAKLNAEIPPHQRRKLDRVQQVALVAAREAWADAGTPEIDPERLGVCVTSGIGGLTTILTQHDTMRERGAARVSPHTVPMLMPNGPGAAVGLELKARAGVHVPVSACASGSEALAFALDMIRAGRADVVVAGGAEAVIHPLPIAAFASMRALSTRNDEPSAASRPYDKARDGFVMGEGAGILVLERESDARARGAKIYGVLAGAGMTSDAHDVVAPEPTGAGAARALAAALRDAGLDPADIAHINAHATSTPQGDVAEALAMRRALGSAMDAVVVSATKGCTGHLLGAAGAVEAIATLLALRDRLAPPTRNLDDPDDAVDIDVARLDPRPLRSGPLAAASNSFGFGGHNVSLAFRSA
ncbi:MAG TPA: beta-ketoacyl-ACP synthase II [Frankiaceae bacterium]|jgi:3-oxoacyl-[acyl-carrier-protein] synthase II|nr:beta-ketoacyl-ACP synthase II [Frankiaceae bacterium]